MSRFIALLFLLAVTIVVSTKPEPNLVPWNELEEGIVENIRVPRGISVGAGKFSNCVCVRAENCPCRNSGIEREANLDDMRKKIAA
ncbi:hypothetical protein PFISCL1PPCAC_3805 [Pristionchus fissidentatus]|uniref:Uncharacterized protein n=1 Tax=Pristionchus fissidentatus TaxID=1538716 RepID=A0AAV5V273_9BILA|nr:hypothetical protein PFISCL1PPCAC_3805 [Pristionchus fissidentatus]